MTYKNFALIYDELMDHAPYDKWATLTIEMIKKFNQDVQTVVDLGCGTGEVAIRLAQKGYDVYGVDISSDMLAIAMDKSLQKKIDIQWIKQDILQFSSFSEIDMVISYCDVFNYITSERDLLISFENVYNCLSDGGLFLFDIHSNDYALNELRNNTFTSRDDDVSYIWECESGSHEGELIHYLTFFVRNNDGYYDRYDEIHHQTVYSIDVYEKLLKEANFTVLHIFSDFSFNKENEFENAERIFILAKK